MKPSICECECNKWCDVEEYFDYENCKCRKRQIDNLVEKCSEDVIENKMVVNVTLKDYGRICKSCTIYIVLLIIKFTIIIEVSLYMFLHILSGVCRYFYWSNERLFQQNILIRFLLI